MRIVTVVVTRDRPQLLQQVLAALQSQHRRPDHIVVVDNGSGPETGAVLAQYSGKNRDENSGEHSADNGAGTGCRTSRGTGGDPANDPAKTTDGTGGTDGTSGGKSVGVEVLRPAANLGGAGGFALGMGHALTAGCDWIWLLDDDAVPRPDALARLTRALATQAQAPGAPRTTGTAGAAGTRNAMDAVRAAGVAGAVDAMDAVGAVAPAVLEFGTLALVHRRHYNLFSGIERAIAPGRYSRAVVPVDTASFVGLLVSARAAAACGLPDAALFLSYDDTDYCLRLRRAGWPLWLAPGSIVDHLRSPDHRLRAGPIGARHYYNLRNRVVVARRHAHLPALAGTVAMLTGLGLWLGCRGRFRKGAWRIVRQALEDGWTGRLGVIPPGLDGRGPHEVPEPEAGRGGLLAEMVEDDWQAHSKERR